MKARLPKGVGGGQQDMNTMIKQAQKMQDELAIKQEELSAREFKASVGGGMVDVTMTGDKKITSITIKPEVVDPDDIEMLQDLVMSAINEVIRDVIDTSDAETEQITNGLNVPGLF